MDKEEKEDFVLDHMEFIEGPPHTYVVCPICERELKTIEYTHLDEKHGMTIEEFEEEYPDSPRICTDTLIRLKRLDKAVKRIEDYLDSLPSVKKNVE